MTLQDAVFVCNGNLVQAKTHICENCQIKLSQNAVAKNISKQTVELRNQK